MRAKDEVFNKFQEFKALVENLSGRKIKVLRSNNGGKYTSNEFKEFCREAGIKRELTTPYNPQQEHVKIMLVWVILLGILFIFWHEKILEFVGNKVDRFIRLEKV